MAGRKGSYNVENVNRFIGAFIEKGTLAAAAEQIGLSEKTVSRWKSQPEFVTVLDQIREFGVQLRLGVPRATAAQSAGITPQNLSFLCQTPEVEKGISTVESLAHGDAAQLLVSAARPKKSKTTTVKKIEGKAGTIVVSTVQEKEVQSVAALKTLLDRTDNSKALGEKSGDKVNKVRSRLTRQNTGLTGEKPVDDRTKYTETTGQNETGLVPQPHGGALQRGPGLGRPPGRVASLTTVAEALTQVHQETGKSYIEALTHALVEHAIDGRLEAAALILTALEKIQVLTPSGGDEDPLFADMGERELLERVLSSVQADLDVIDADIVEVID